MGFLGFIVKLVHIPSQRPTTATSHPSSTHRSLRPLTSSTALCVRCCSQQHHRRVVRGSGARRPWQAIAEQCGVQQSGRSESRRAGSRQRLLPPSSRASYKQSIPRMASFHALRHSPHRIVRAFVQRRVCVWADALIAEWIRALRRLLRYRVAACSSACTIRGSRAATTSVSSAAAGRMTPRYRLISPRARLSMYGANPSIFHSLSAPDSPRSAAPSPHPRFAPQRPPPCPCHRVPACGAPRRCP